MSTQKYTFTSLRRAAWRAWLMASALSLLAYSLVLAASGDLDASFSGDGLVTFNFPGALFSEHGEAVAVQLDGKIVVAGERFDEADPAASTADFVVVRYNADGTLDNTFSGDGKQVIGFGAGVSNTASAVVIQPDGKIVIAGSRGSYGNSDFAIYRLNRNGSPDTTFSGDGRARVDFGGNEGASDLALQSDGKIVIVGEKGLFGATDMALARLNANGTLDNTFSGDGKQTTNFGASEEAGSVVIQPNGKIVVAGSKCAAGCDVAVARYNVNGSLDITFSGDGRQVIGHGAGVDNMSAGGLVIQPDGRIVIAGWMDNGSNFDFALYRLKSGGALDTSFNGDGRAAFDFGLNLSESPMALALQGDGKYVLAGDIYYGGGHDYDLAVARIMP